MPIARLTRTQLDANYAAVHPDFAAKHLTRHQRTFEVALADGESFTNQPPNAGDAQLVGLDERGTIRVGVSVAPRIVLVGKSRKREGPEASPEEKLLRAIFGEGVDFVNTSVTVAAIEPIDADVAWARGGASGNVEKTQPARDLLEARSIGPYDDRTQQPVAGRDQMGGQLVDPALGATLGAHAPWALWEMATLKSDCPTARTVAYYSRMKDRGVICEDCGVEVIQLQRVGWVCRAAHDGKLVDHLVRAVAESLSDPVEDPMVACFLGRTPQPPDEDEVDVWRTARQQRLDRLAEAFRATLPEDPREEIFQRPVEELEMSVRLMNVLEAANIRTIGELCQRTEEDLLKTGKFGRTTLAEGKELLADFNLSLGTKRH